MDLLSLCVGMTFVHLMTFVLHNHAKVSTICLESINGLATIPLTCGSNKRIHVISERYGDTTREHCGQNKSTIFATSLMSSQDGLIVNCNGKQNTTCHEGIIFYSCKRMCATEIKHECAEDSMSVCSAVNTRSDNESVYLHSPGFPNPDKEDNNCRCRITGPRMNVTVLEYRPGDGAVSIFPDSRNVFPTFFTQYNRVIATDVSTVAVNYENKNKSGSLWIKVAGSDPLNIECMKEPNMTSTQATTSVFTSFSESTYHRTVTPSTSNEVDVVTPSTSNEVDVVTPSTSNDRTDQVMTGTASGTSGEDTSSAATTDRVPSSSSIASNPTSNTTNDGSTDDINIVAIVGGLCGIILLLLVIISFLVYFKVIKPTRNHPSAKKTDIRKEQDMTVSYAHYEDVTDSTSDSPTHDCAVEISRHTSNPYNDLSRYENRGVHEYEQLHVYEGTESRVEPPQDYRTYSGLSNYVNQGDHHNYGEIRRDK